MAHVQQRPAAVHTVLRGGQYVVSNPGSGNEDDALVRHKNQKECLLYMTDGDEGQDDGGKTPSAASLVRVRDREPALTCTEAAGPLVWAR